MTRSHPTSKFAGATPRSKSWRRCTFVARQRGHDEDTIIRQGVLRQGVAYLRKADTPRTLTQRARAALDAGLSGCNDQAPAATASTTPELPLVTASSSASASAATAPITVTTGF